ncbi:hypothetical protein EIO60_00097|nr:hypothetical protein [Candidatus Pantoea persica]
MRSLGKGERRIACRCEVNTADIQFFEHLRPCGKLNPAYFNALFLQPHFQRAAILQQSKNVSFLIADIYRFWRGNSMGSRNNERRGSNASKHSIQVHKFISMVLAHPDRCAPV